MRALPESLKPWAAQLALFPEDTALALGEAVRRLRALFGPLGRERPEVTGDPDGYSGLMRRGHYERLLISEWMIADELPEEFIRRASMREHAFLKLAHSESVQGRRSIVLLDSGPDQIGAPRIAQLATLIVLEWRALAAGAQFEWGVLQHVQEHDALHTGITEDSVDDWLHARTSLPASADQVQSWLAHIEPGPEDELWLVSPLEPEPDQGGRALRRVCIEEIPEPGRRALHVQVTGNRRGKNELILELPEPRQTVRLLRNPFEQVRPSTQTQDAAIALHAPILFAPSGRRFIVTTQDGGLAAYPTQGRDAGRAQAPTRFSLKSRPGEHIVAVGWRRREFVVLTTRDNTLYLLGHVDKHSGIYERRFDMKRLETEFYAGDEPAQRPLYLSFTREGKRSFICPDAYGGLFEFTTDNEPRVSALSGYALCMGYQDNCVVYIESARLENKSMENRFVVVNNGWRSHTTINDKNYTQGFFASGGNLRQESWRCFALGDDSGNWDVFTGLNHVRIPCDPQSRVIGVVLKNYQEAALVVIDPQRTSLSLLGKKTREPLLSSEHEILNAALNPHAPNLVYTTDAGEIVVCAINDAQVLARYLPEPDA